MDTWRVAGNRFRFSVHFLKYGIRAAQRAGTSAGVRLSVRYLPKYSPDLNPIELVYSKMKALLRRVAARTVPVLVRTIRSFVLLLGTLECARYLRHAGYASI